MDMTSTNDSALTTKRHPLFTTGYAGFDSVGFLWKLRFDNIEAVIDIRENAYSRNSAFCEHALRTFLEKNGIRYLHVQQLGVPKSLRQELRSGGDLGDYFEAYEEFLRGEESIIAAIIPTLLEKRCCLLCLEKNPSECHRSVLANCINQLYEDTFEVKHI